MDKLKILLLLILILTLAASGCLEDELPEPGDTPEGTFHEYVARVNDRDGEGALRWTTASFMEGTIFEEENEEFVKAVDNGYMSIVDYEILDVVHEEDMTRDESIKAQDVADHVEEYGNVSVQETSILEVGIEVMFDFPDMDEPKGDAGITLTTALKIENIWYLSELKLQHAYFEEIDGSLSVDELEDHQVELGLMLNNPSSVNEGDIIIRVFDQHDHEMDPEEFDIRWYNPDVSYMVTTGSSLELTFDDVDSLAGFYVVMEVEGYEGRISKTLG